MGLRPGDLTHFMVAGRSIAHRNSPADQGVLHQVFGSQDYEFSRLSRNAEIDALYASLERPLVVDCGANIGASAVWFAQRYPKAGVLAIEPDADNFALLEMNSAGLPVGAVRGAIAGRPGTVPVIDAGIGEWGYRTSGPGPVLAEVRAFTLSQLLAMAPDGMPFVLKIDIEGGETDLFGDEPEVFARFPIIVIELHDWMLPRAGTSRPFLRWHAERNRDFVHIGENVFSLCNELLPAAS